MTYREHDHVHESAPAPVVEESNGPLAVPQAQGRGGVLALAVRPLHPQDDAFPTLALGGKHDRLPGVRDGCVEAEPPPRRALLDPARERWFRIGSVA